MPVQAALFDAYLTAFLTGPVSILLGTADRLNTPDVTRVAGIARVGEARLRLLISAQADAAKANAVVDAAASVLVTDITNYRSIQWKGVVAQAAGPRTPGDVALMHHHVAAFTEGAARVGIRPETVPPLFPTDIVALELEVDARYEQTPGVGAGRQVV